MEVNNRSKTTSRKKPFYKQEKLSTINNNNNNNNKHRFHVFFSFSVLFSTLSGHCSYVCVQLVGFSSC